MSLANKLTLFRVILAPLFFIIFMLPRFICREQTIMNAWTIPVLIIIFVASQVTDLLDGMAARKYNETSDFGKFFDPFADTITQVTCFLCFVVYGVFPVVLYLLVIYREFSILFIRNLMLQNGITMGARMSGKVKTVSYVVAGGAALLVESFNRLGATIVFFQNTFGFLLPYIKIGALVIFIIAVTISIFSFFDYLLVYLKAEKSK